MLALALLLLDALLEPRVLGGAPDDDPAEEAGHDAEADEVGDPRGQRVATRLVQVVVARTTARYMPVITIDDQIGAPRPKRRAAPRMTSP